MTMAEDVIKRAQAGWLIEFGHLDELAVDVVHSRHGAFLRRFASAWLHADVFNKRIIREAWEKLIEKYGLEENRTGVPGS